jgi:hypothetical protein
VLIARILSNRSAQLSSSAAAFPRGSTMRPHGTAARPAAEKCGQTTAPEAITCGCVDA